MIELDGRIVVLDRTRLLEAASRALARGPPAPALATLLLATSAATATATAAALAVARPAPFRPTTLTTFAALAATPPATPAGLVLRV